MLLSFFNLSFLSAKNISIFYISYKWIRFFVHLIKPFMIKVSTKHLWVDLKVCFVSFLLFRYFLRSTLWDSKSTNFDVANSLKTLRYSSKLLSWSQYICQPWLYCPLFKEIQYRNWNYRLHLCWLIAYWLIASSETIWLWYVKQRHYT